MNNSSSILFLINPLSGGNRARKIINRLREHTNSSVIVEELSFEKIESQIITASNHDTVVIGGGDGTVSRLLTMLTSHPRVGILPLGTANDLARELGILEIYRTYTLPALIEFYRSAQTRILTIGCAEFGEDFSEKIYFSNYLSLGFDAQVIADFDILRRSFLWRSLRSVWSNRLGYLLTSIKNLSYQLPKGICISSSHNPPYQLSKNGKTILFANIRSVIGMGETNKISSAFDNQIECLTYNNLFQYLSMVAGNSLRIIQPSFIGSSADWLVSAIPSGVFLQYDGEPYIKPISSNLRISIGKKVSIITNHEGN